MRRVICSTLLLTGLIGCSGTSVDVTPLVLAADTSGAEALVNASESNSISGSDLATIEGRYAYDADECTVERRSNSTPSLTQLNEIRSRRNATDFVVTLNTIGSNSTAGRTIAILSLADGTNQTASLTATSSGTFATMTMLNHRCSIEFVQGGAVATCRYNEVPAVCDWYFSRN